MERNIYMDDEFDKFLKEKADQYKLYPSDKAWTNIQRSLRPQRKWPYLTLTILLLLGSSVIVDHRNFNMLVSNGKPGIPQIVSTNSSSSSFKPGAIQSTSSNSPLGNDQNPNSNTIALSGIQMQAFTAATRGSDPINSNTLKQRLQKAEEYADLTAAAASSNEIEHNPIVKLIEKSSALPDKENKTKIVTVTENEESASNNIKKVLWGGEVFRKSKFGWQISFSPTVSYRRLTSGLQDITDVFRGVPYSADQKVNSVNNSVTQKPAIGAEVGLGLTYRVTNNFLLKAGLQLNYSRYQLKALPVKQEQATLAVVSNGWGTDSVTAPSTLLNYGGRGASWLNNEYYQISMPIGFEWGVLGNSTFKWNIAASAQPVYNFANNVYLLSTDFKHYAQDPSLVRRWNINAGVETFVSYNMGSFKMQAGPQLRYQLLSSYKNQYPIKEYMVDFGFKIGITKTLR